MKCVVYYAGRKIKKNAILLKVSSLAKTEPFSQKELLQSFSLDDDVRFYLKESDALNHINSPVFELHCDCTLTYDKNILNNETNYERNFVIKIQSVKKIQIKYEINSRDEDFHVKKYVLTENENSLSHKIHALINKDFALKPKFFEKLSFLSLFGKERSPYYDLTDKLENDYVTLMILYCYKKRLSQGNSTFPPMPQFILELIMAIKSTPVPPPHSVIRNKNSSLMSSSLQSGFFCLNNNNDYQLQPPPLQVNNNNNDYQPQPPLLQVNNMFSL